MKRWIKSFLALVMILSLVSTFATPVFATTLNFYINDGSETVHFTNEADATGTGWSYQASTNELTLSGFSGTSILVDGNFTLVLDGTNTINVTSESESHLVGSLSTGGSHTLTIRAKTSSSLDSLNFVGHD